MNLPTIETPQYTCMLPIAQKEVTYRPFLVGEQKSLLISQEAENVHNSIKEILRLITACTMDSIDINRLSPTDLEFLFLQIRIISVGETSEVGINCEECGEENIVTINYLNHEVLQPSEIVDKILKINDQISLELRVPHLLDIADISKKHGDNPEDSTQATFDMLTRCIDKIMHEDEVLTRDDFSEEDLNKFVEGMTIDMLESMMKFIENQPSLVIPNDFNCKKCEANNPNIIAGMENFFV